MTRVLVTGANGFIGQALCRELILAGFEVTGAVRDKAGRDKAGPGEAGFDAVATGEVGPDTDWREALRDAEIVVHLAGRAHATDGAGALALYRRINVEGTRRLAEAADESGARRLVFLSSVKVHGEASGATPFTERDPPAPEDPYGISKWEAEQALARATERSDLVAVILRAPLVYGPGVKGNFGSLLRVCDGPLPLPFGAVTNRRSLIYLANLTGAIRECVTNAGAKRKTFVLRDGEDISTPELIRRLRAALGRPARLISVPPSSLRRLAGIVGRKAAAGRLLDSLTVDDGLIRSSLGWSPPLGLDEGLRLTAEWFRAHGTARRGAA
ncbi:MAG: NAD-dependent epimerase/dehydratase family protein [Proteobacteria bacterium]|nr:NAD-dependent epimerase/dehydratase family protein [Pseudomonadota bacterium]